jgi:hypothetical protein
LEEFELFDDDGGRVCVYRCRIPFEQGLFALELNRGDEFVLDGGTTLEGYTGWQSLWDSDMKRKVVLWEVNDCGANNK